MESRKTITGANDWANIVIASRNASAAQSARKTKEAKRLIEAKRPSILADTKHILYMA